MSFTGTLQVTTQGDREVRLVREFDAPRRLVWDCFTKPELVRRWLFGPDGWSFLVCDIDFRVGGTYRFVTVPELLRLGRPVYWHHYHRLPTAFHQKLT